MCSLADQVVLVRAAVAAKCGRAVWVKGEEGFKAGWPPSSLCCGTVVWAWCQQQAVRISRQTRGALQAVRAGKR